MKARLIILTILLVGVAACKRDKLKEDKTILIGKWSWIYSSHSSGWCQFNPVYATVTPDSIGKQHSVEFLSKGKIKFFEDGVEKDERRLVFDYFEQDTSGHYFFYIYLDNKKDEGMAGSLGDDTLRFDYPLTPDNPNCESYLNFLVRE